MKLKKGGENNYMFTKTCKKGKTPDDLINKADTMKCQLKQTNLQETWDQI